MKYLIAISGPVASGKSILADEILKRFASHRISTRQLLIDAGAENDRSKLIEAGSRLDRETDGKWVLEGSRKYIDRHQQDDVVLIDAVRTAQQIHHLRDEYGERLVHVHVEVPLEVAKRRYEERAADGDLPSYDEVRADPTEAGVWSLGGIADRVVENTRCEPPSLLARAVAGLGLFPLVAIPLVDVIVSGQYGSEGKGHICAHLAGGYGVLVRVGGPNAGHNVASPKYNYRQLPSGTQSNAKAKILIAAGSTILPERILKESEIAVLGRIASSSTSRRW